jgi:hypothetical protein
LAKVFNNQVRDGKTEELVFAAVVEDKEEQHEDDIDKNKTADEDAKDEAEEQ